MNARLRARAGALALMASTSCVDAKTDPRLREVVYDERAVVEVAVRRGSVLHIALDDDEAIGDVASGLNSDCAKPDAPWCIAAAPGARHLFIKAKSTAGAANNLIVVTDRRSHTFRFSVLADTDPQPGLYQLTIKAPVKRPAAKATPDPVPEAVMPPEPPPREIVAQRLQAASPSVVNANYAIAEGTGSDDIAPTLVFDDGRFTYFRFPANREVPAVFHVLGDGSETVVNSRMEGDLLVVDRVSRLLMLRAGQAVVGVWNEAFDLDGAPPADGTTVPGVQRVLKADSSPPGAVRKGATR